MPPKETAQETTGSDVRRQVLEECKAMAAYAFGAGIKVPESLIGRLGQAEARMAPPRTEKSEPGARPGRSAETASEGKPDDPAKDTLPRDPADLLTQVHNRLAELVAPATPRTILLLAREEAKGSPLRFLGAVPLIRRLLIVALVSMCGFVWISLSEDVDGNGFDLLKNSGFNLLLSELFLLFAASIGVSFANLFEAQRFIKDGTFDPKFESSYWVRHVLGLMAGTILALLVPIEALAAEQESTILQQLGKPMLALLGGFSASAVHRILSRLVAALETLVKGDTRDLMAAQDRAGKARLAERETQSRMELSSQLIHLEETLSGSSDPKEALASLRELQRRLIRGEEADVSSPSS